MDVNLLKKILLSPFGLLVMLMIYLVIGGGIFLAIEGQSEGSHSDQFHGWLNYCVIAISTIGYGHIRPITNTGRLVTIPYVLMGIPLFLATVYKLGRLLVDGIVKLKTFIISQRSTDNEEQQPANSPAWHIILPCITLGIFFVYAFAGAGIICHIKNSGYESWDYATAIYFVFVSITTIGFGDLIVYENEAFGTTYVIFGIVLLSMVFHSFADSCKAICAKAKHGTCTEESAELADGQMNDEPCKG